MERMKSRGLLIRPLLAAAVSVAAMGCATFSEKYYFRANSAEAENPLYYRVGIRGSTCFSKSRYSAGFFDKRAVDDLFGEVAMERALERSQAELAKEQAQREELGRKKDKIAGITVRRDAAEKAYLGLVQAAPQDADAIAKARAHVVEANQDLKTAEEELATGLAKIGGVSEQVLDPTGKAIDLQDKRFVLFMNSNSDALARALQKIAEEEIVVQSMVAIANQDIQQDLAAAARERQAVLTISRDVAAKAEAALATVAGTAWSDAAVGSVQAELLGLVNRTAMFYGAPRFASEVEARAWLEKNTGNFVSGLTKGGSQ